MSHLSAIAITDTSSVPFYTTVYYTGFRDRLRKSFHTQEIELNPIMNTALYIVFMLI